jgi:exopolysaccharide biosynthesis WecB/TagA/CpsF family protein
VAILARGAPNNAGYNKSVRVMENALDIDNYDLKEALQIVSGYGVERYGYVVTPNVDHIIRHSQDGTFRSLYAHASYVFLDSRFLANLLGLFKQRHMRVCLGSDLTGELLGSVMKPDDTAVLVGATAQQAEQLRSRYKLNALQHIDPPMNFINDEQAVEDCLRAIEAASPFRFCFVAIGSPQQEIIAYKLKERGIARGLSLCVGAAVNFLTGVEKRAPLFMQQMGLEWLYRLIRDPRRLARRYLVRGPRIFPLLWRLEFRLRRPTAIADGNREAARAAATTTPISGSAA